MFPLTVTLLANEFAEVPLPTWRVAKLETVAVADPLLLKDPVRITVPASKTTAPAPPMLPA